MSNATPEPVRGEGRAASLAPRASVDLRRSVSQTVGESEAYVRDDQSEHDDDDAESDGAEGDALAEDEFGRQQAIYAAQQRNMG